MDRPTFNLSTNPFIPCRCARGDLQAFTLQSVLVHAHEIQAIEDASPLFIAAIHRLLLVILHRVFGPESVAAWAGLYQRQAFPDHELNAYFDRWRDRFDLFHPDHPFFQDPLLDTGHRNGINQLVREMARGSNATLFDHTNDSRLPLLPPDRVARALITEQAFAVGGGKS